MRTGTWAANLDLASHRFSDRVTIELRSDTFVPKGVMDGGKNTDTRALGVQVKGVMLQRDEAGQPEAEKRLMLRGRAMDAQGQPAAGIVVAARPTGGRGERSLDIPPGERVPCLSLTNERGEFCVGPLEAGDYEIRPQNLGDETRIAGRTQRPLPDAFPPQKVTLRPGPAPSVELRGVPSVTLEVQYTDSAGKPVGGFPLFLTGSLGGTPYWAFEEQNTGGHFAFRAPKGLQAATLNAPWNERMVFRYRTAKGAPLSHVAKLGTLTSDLADIAIVRYRIPVLLVRASTENGEPIQHFKPRVDYAPDKGSAASRKVVVANAEKVGYAPPKAPEAKRRRPDGIEGDVAFVREDDDRWRSASFILPDEPITLTVEAAGYKPKSQKLSLPEGAVKELNVTLEPR